MIEHIELTNLSSNTKIILDCVTTQDYVLERVELDPLTADYNLQPLPSLYGDTLANTRFVTRHLKIIAWVLPDTSASESQNQRVFAERKSALNAFFIPSQYIKLETPARDRATGNTVNYSLTFLPDTSPQYGYSIEENNEYMCKFVITGVCLSPFFEYDRYVKSFTVQSSTSARTASIYNYGDVPVGCRFEMKRVGTSTPTYLYTEIRKASSSETLGYMRFNTIDPVGGLPFAVNDVLKVSTEHGEESMELTKSDGNVYNWASSLVWDTAVWLMFPCAITCNILFGSSGGGSNAKTEVDLYVTELYMGVE